MNDELTQEELNEWSYLSEQEMNVTQHIKPANEYENKEQLAEFKKVVKEIGLNLIEDQKFLWIGVGENATELTKGFYWQLSKNNVERDLNLFDVGMQRFWLEEGKESGFFDGLEQRYNYRLEWIEKIDNLQKSLKQNQYFKEKDVQTIPDEEKESIDKEIQTLENEKQEFIGPKQKREFAREKLDGLDKNEELKESLEILKEKEKIDEQIKEKEAQIEKEQEKREKEQNTDNKEIKDNQENIAEQEDWIKRADELELQHQKELEDLKDKQSRLEANFQKSIDNLMSSDGINGVITALQEMDRSLEMMMRQGKEESEAKDRQRQEKLELAFDSPKFREAVSDLVKEVYKEHKEVKNGLKEMEKEHGNYAKLKTTYEKEVKNGLDVKGHEKLSKMMGDIEKETPNFKNSYPKFYKKVNDSLEQAKDKILNKTKENDKGRSL
ncbi:TPA: hypothetical protein RQJ16_001773 [Campylobacter fetus subsp. venerealis]|nr:hypothetical protein [Campylobacter fetus subsp. venerealis]HDX8135926.1 hypothetical protein [Campylobacter fetus subsp. venerealis]